MSPAEAEALRQHVHRTARRLGLNPRPRPKPEEPVAEDHREYEELDGRVAPTAPGCRRKRVVRP